MQGVDDSPHRLTTFPVAFPEEEEKNQVNQVISSLFSKVRSRFAPPTPGGSSSTATNTAQQGTDAVGLAEERDGLPGLPASSARRTSSRGSRPSNQDLQSFTFGRADSGDGSINRPPSLRLPSGESSKPTSIKSSVRPPALPRSLSSRPAPGPAPPLISTTPVIRTQDFAHYLHQNATGSSDNLSTTANGASTPTRTRDRSDSRSYVPRHRHTGSASSFTRFRKPSMTGSLLQFSPSSVNLASSYQSEGPPFDYTQVPGFAIADDARSIRTIDTTAGYAMNSALGGDGNGRRKRESKEGQVSVAKIIRRLRGEGLSKAYWMADETCKECYDCKSVFSAWRRKHHCRICGQIFCSRCAPNIIKGYRFGVEGTVRVCNLCLELMNECDDEEDRRSVISNGNSQLPLSAGPVFHVSEETAPADRKQSFGYSQSPFAASHLFRHVSHGDTLGAIRENGYRRTSGNSALDDRSDDDNSPPGTPLYERGRSDSLMGGHTKHPLLHVRPRNTSRAPGDSAPFRRTINEEDTGTDGQGTPKSHEIEIEPADDSRNAASANKTAGADPLVVPDEAVTRSLRSPRPDAAQAEAERMVQPLIAFPTSSLAGSPTKEKILDRPAHVLSPQSTHAKFTISEPPGSQRTRLSSRISTSGLSGVLLSDNLGASNMWGNQRDLPEGGNDVLPMASLTYFRLMLRQMLEREKIAKANDWEEVLTRLLLQTALTIKSSVDAGDSMDIRTYVKIKKIPGGKIAQSEYVDGTVITKNLEHKHMPRHMLNPRIMLLTFPIDYHRVESQLVSLEPLLAQERNYLQHLTRRITDLRPHIVLVERNVSRLALDFLMNAKVSVARGVKPSALQQVARCTQADIIGSMDRLAMEPRLGRCVEFKVQTFEHRLIPGFRKTFMRFEGCHAAFGCTLILRGGDVDQLQAIKRITDFMVLVMNNLKMEVCLFYDDFNILPPASLMTNDGEPPGFVRQSSIGGTSAFGSLGRASTTSIRKDRAEEQEQADRQSEEIEKSLRPYLDTAISSSAAVAYPPPAPIARMSQLDRRLRQLRLARDEAEAEQILLEEGHGATTPKATDAQHLQELSFESQDSSRSNGTIKANTASEKASERFASGTVLLAIEEIKLESDIAQTEFEHSEQLKLWSWYVSRHPPDLRPELYQGINYLSSLVCEGSDKPCVGPQMLTRNFYMHDDRAIGQYLESLCNEATQACPNKQCTKLQLHHFQVLVHGSTRLQIAIDQFPCPSPGNENKVITWSYCKLCKEASPTALIKEETWNMSWSKYLEHAFYPPCTRGGFGCPHDAYRDQIRYFALRNLAIRIHNEEIDIYEVQRPSLTLQVRQESRVLIKNQEYATISMKSASFFDSVSLRLRTFDCQLVKPDSLDELRQDLLTMSDRAMSDRQSMQEGLDRTYKLSSATDVLALNAVYLALQDRVVQWDTDFQDLEKKYLPSEKDIRHMTAAHLKRLFAGQDFFPSADRTVSGQTITDLGEDAFKEKGGAKAQEAADKQESARPTASEKDSASQSLEVPALVLDSFDDPLATPLAERPPDSKGEPSNEDGAAERDYDSESTISALPRGLAEHRPLTAYHQADSSTSGLESDAVVFASRLPRRTRPAPTVADLVRRFQDSTQLERTIESLGYRLPASANVLEQSQRESDSDQDHQTRPRLKRNKTEGYHSRNRTTKSSQMSDGGGSYALNASRIPTLSAPRRPNLNRYLSVGHEIKEEEPSNLEEVPDPAPAVLIQRSHSPRLRRNNSELSSERDRTKRQRAEIGKVGKGKAPVRHAIKQDSLGDGSRPSTPGARLVSRRGGNLGGNRVSTIARHFDKLSKEAERDHVRRMNQARGRRARPVGVTRAKIHVFSNARDAFRDDETDSASSEADDEEDNEAENELTDKDEGDAVQTVSRTQDAATVPVKVDDAVEPLELPSPIPTPNAEHLLSGSSTPSFEPTSVTPSEAPTDISFKDRLQITLPPFATSTPLLSVPPTPLLTGQIDTHTAASHASETEGQGSVGQERHSILKTLSNLWAYRSGDVTLLEYPLSASEHVFTDSIIIVREDEPTSIIAFTLASKTYRDRLRSVGHNRRETRRTDGTAESSTATLLDDTASVLSTGNAYEDPQDTDDTWKREAGTHINYDIESGNSTISCRIFYAERFAALRSSCGCEDRFIDSLARCIKFDSSGGKSGSAFLKTRDDRFIAKEVSRLELDALTKFAPAYFEYMKQSIQHKRPTALAKIYGCFKIGYNNTTTGKAMRMNVVIMENLFYERRFDRIYDLKGSVRNRLVQATGKENQVLLDENLMEVINRQPLYMRDHCKQILRTALWNDTLFLSGLNVMDYSLVVGVDVERKELVVGVVDYIRTFTWDKKLESWVKDLGGGGRGEPTIVTPKQYKVRYRTAMEKYFPAVPDRWTRITDDNGIKPDEDSAQAL